MSYRIYCQASTNKYHIFIHKPTSVTIRYYLESPEDIPTHSLLDESEIFRLILPKKNKLCPNKFISVQRNVFHPKFLFEYQFWDLLSQIKTNSNYQKNPLWIEVSDNIINDLLFPSGLIFINTILVRIKIDHINYTKPQWKTKYHFQTILLFNVLISAAGTLGKEANIHFVIDYLLFQLGDIGIRGLNLVCQGAVGVDLVHSSTCSDNSKDSYERIDPRLNGNILTVK